MDTGCSVVSNQPFWWGLRDTQPENISKCYMGHVDCYKVHILCCLARCSPIVVSGPQITSPLL